MTQTRRAFLAMSAISGAAALSGCGTILYPERRGQTGGRIDVGVAVLDGVGLLLFLVPGLVAFAIDFSTGAIYLPGTGFAAEGDVRAVERAGPYDDVAMDAAWREATGEARPFQNADVRLVGPADPDDLVSVVIRLRTA